MPACVVDASAVLALLDEEEGTDAAADVLEDAAISAVNLAEVVAHLIRGGLPPEELDGVLAPFPFAVHPFPFAVHPFAEADARAAGLMRAVTEPVRRALPPPRRTLSHGDQACLAPAARLALPAVTADRDRALYAEAAEVEVRTIR